MDEHHKKVEIMQGAELHKIAQKENYAASSSRQQSAFIQLEHPPAFGARFARFPFSSHILRRRT